MQQNFVSTTSLLEMLGEKLLVCFLRMLGGREGGGSEFQNPLFHVFRRKPCPDQYFTLLFALVFITVTVSSHPSVIWNHHFISGKMYMKVTWNNAGQQLPPRVSMWCGWGFRGWFSLWAVFTDFTPTLPIPLGMVSTVCSKDFSFHWFSVWQCLVVASHRVVMDTLCIRLCLSYGLTLFRHHDPRSSIVVGVNHLMRVTVSRPYHTCKKCTCKILS